MCSTHILFTVYLTRDIYYYTHNLVPVPTVSCITTISNNRFLWHSLQGLTWFICKSEFHLDVKILYTCMEYVEKKVCNSVVHTTFEHFISALMFAQVVRSSKFWFVSSFTQNEAIKRISGLVEF